MAQDGLEGVYGGGYRAWMGSRMTDGRFPCATEGCRRRTYGILCLDCDAQIRALRWWAWNKKNKRSLWRMVREFFGF